MCHINKVISTWNVTLFTLSLQGRTWGRTKVGHESPWCYIWGGSHLVKHGFSCFERHLENAFAKVALISNSNSSFVIGGKQQKRVFNSIVVFHSIQEMKKKIERSIKDQEPFSNWRFRINFFFCEKRNFDLSFYSLNRIKADRKKRKWRIRRFCELGAGNKKKWDQFLHLKENPVDELKEFFRVFYFIMRDSRRWNDLCQLSRPWFFT